MRRARISTLIAGAVLVLLGAWIVLDDQGVVALSFAALGAVLAGSAGAILLASGLEERE